MARDTLDDTPIESIDQLASWLEDGCKPASEFLIGTEHEKFGFHIGDYSPVAYEGPRSIRTLLEGMEGLLGWERIMDGDAIIGLVDPTGGGAISLEPGGQFELSGAPLDSIHQTCRETNAHLAQLREIAEPLGIGFLGVGASPKWRLEDTPRMPKSRYDIMTNYMPKVGSLGLDMMYRTSTIQVNLDFADEADMVRKMRVGLALQPVATAIFANSPFLDGKPNGYLSYRSEVWRHTDPDRTGMMPFAFEEGFGFEAYVDWVIDVPMYFVKRGETYHDVTGTTFRRFMDGGLDLLPGERPNLGDWNNHLSTMFPEVRLKRYIEMRGADGGPWRKICALPAFWVGLLYDDEALAEVSDLIADWTAEERQKMRDEVPKTAFQTPFRRGTLYDVANRVLAISRNGLYRRARRNAAGFDETSFLAPVEEVLATGETPAEKMLRRYYVDWGGNIDRVFEELAY